MGTVDQLREQMQRQLERNRQHASLYAKWLLRMIPASALIALVTAALLIEFWGFREFLRMTLQVVLTLTLGAAILAGLINRLEKRLQE